jgi:CubicO group peptidase (beta-lactamase class C family)
MLSRLRPVLVATALMGVPVASAADDAVDTYVLAEMARQKIPGVAVLIVKGGAVVKQRGYGLANVEHGVPVKADTIFQTGSVGKQFTATAVMLLVEDGRLALDDSIRKYFPEAPADWQSITLRRLLTHTSGVRGEGDEDLDLQRNYTDDELAKNFFDHGLSFVPGSRWAYSNAGYVLLGALVKRVSGRFYGDILAERVFGPLGMKTARVISDTDIVMNRAAGYELKDGVLKNQDWVSATLNATADGSLYLALPDYLAWDRGLRAGRILKPESWKQVYTPVTLASGKTYPYGFGWGVDTLNGQTVYSHGGSWQGFRSSIARYLGSDLTVVVLANLAQASTEAMGDHIAGLFDARLKQPELKPIPGGDAPAEARLRALLGLAAAGTLTKVETIPVGSFKGMEKYYQEMVAPLGAPGAFTLVDRRSRGDDAVTAWDVAFAKRTARVHLTLDPDGKLVSLSVEPH